MAVAGLDDESDSNSSDEYLHQGSIIALENTESALDLGSLIDTFVANKDNNDSKELTHYPFNIRYFILEFNTYIKIIISKKYVSQISSFIYNTYSWYFICLGN